MAEIHLRARDIHPTILGSVVYVKLGRKLEACPFEGALMLRLRMYDPETGHSIAGTLKFTPDGEVDDEHVPEG